MLADESPLAADTLGLHKFTNFKRSTLPLLHKVKGIFVDLGKSLGDDL